MDAKELNAIREHANAFAKEHCVVLARELIEWHDTGLLRTGKLRELARIWSPVDGANSLKLAENNVNRAALENAALPSDAAQAPLSNEQREAFQWAADRAHVESLGKSIGGVEGRRWRILMDLSRAAPVAPAAAAPSAPFITLTGAQLLEALDFAAPDRETEGLQLEHEVTIQRGDGHSGPGFYCWLTDEPEEGAILLDGLTATVPPEPSAAQPDECTGLETPSTLSTDAVAQLSTETVDNPVQRMSDAARDVLAERARQMNEEGFTPAHDDQYEPGTLATAAGCYGIWGWGDSGAHSTPGDDPKPWPWDRKWWKPSNLRRHCVKGAALYIAEIERIDRAQEPPEAQAGK